MKSILILKDKFILKSKIILIWKVRFFCDANLFLELK